MRRAASGNRRPGRRHGHAVATHVLALALLVLATSPPASADRHSINFAWVADPAASSYAAPAYHSYNDGGGAVAVRRLSTERHDPGHGLR